VTIDDLARCVGRELGIRRRVYVNWMALGRMKKDEADHEIACMEKVHEIMTRLRDCGRVEIKGWQSLYSERDPQIDLDAAP
jgi:hypothetical protein